MKCGLICARQRAHLGLGEGAREASSSAELDLGRDPVRHLARRAHEPGPDAGAKATIAPRRHAAREDRGATASVSRSPSRMRRCTCGRPDARASAASRPATAHGTRRPRP
jgi:hypothetical protein